MKSSPLPARTLQAPQQALRSAHISLQKAGAALAKEDYLAVEPALEGVAAEIEAALRQLDAPPAAAPNRRKR